MSELIVWNVMTLNGYFNGKNDWEIDLHDAVWGDDLEQMSLEQMKEVDILIFGRKTYEGMASHWSTAKGETANLLNKVPKIVFSKTLDEIKWNNTELVREDAVKYIKSVKKTGNNKYFIMGSADLLSKLHEEKLVDEYRICIAPVVLGRGIPLFKDSNLNMTLKLKKSLILKSGGIILWLNPVY